MKFSKNFEFYFYIFNAILILFYSFSLISRSVYYDTSILNFFKYLGFQLIYLILPGYFMLNRFKSLKNFGFPIAYSLGIGLLFLQYFIFFSTNTKVLIYIFSPLLSIFLLFDLKKSIFNFRLHFRNYHFSIVLILLIFSLYTFSDVNLRPDLYSLSSYAQDLLWTIGNNQSLERAFPPISSRIDLLPLKYHYFVSIYHAISTFITKINHFEYFFKYSQIFMIIFYANSIFLFGKFFIKNKKFYLLYLFLAFFTQCVSSYYALEYPYGLVLNVYYYHIYIYPFGFELAISAMMLTSILFIQFPNVEDEKIKRIFLIIFLLVLTTGAKGVLGLILACTFFIIMMIRFIEKKPNYVFILPILISFLLIYSFLLSDSSGTLKLSLGHTLKNSPLFNVIFKDHSIGMYTQIMLIPIHFLFWLPFSSFYSITWLIQVLKTPFKLSDEQYLFAGVIFAGILGSNIFEHRGNSQLYFLLAAVPFLHVVATNYIASKWFEYSILRKMIAYFLLFLGFSSAAFSFSVFIKSGIISIDRANSFLNDKQSNFPNYDTITPLEYEGLSWIAINTSPESLIATNRIYSSPDQNKVFARDYYSSVFSNRQIFFEGYSAEKPVMGFENIIAQREHINSLLFKSDTKTIESIAEKFGIDYILQFSLIEPHIILPFKIVFKNRDVIIYKVNPNEEK